MDGWVYGCTCHGAYVAVCPSFLSLAVVNTVTRGWHAHPRSQPIAEGSQSKNSSRKLGSRNCDRDYIGMPLTGLLSTAHYVSFLK